MSNENIQTLSIDISVQEPEWENQPEVESQISTAVETAVKMAKLPDVVAGKNLEISIVLGNDDLIHVLNKEYREKDNPTNILTFATIDGEEPEHGDVFNLGDVVLAYQTIEREANEQEKFIRDHIMHLAVHGTLHLLGYTHSEESEATIMESLEIRVLEKLGVQNPYTEKIFIV